MILTESDRRSINMSARNREQKRAAKGQEASARELFALQKLYPDYAAILEACPGRDYSWAKRMARKFEIATKKHIWTAQEEARLRKMWPDGNLTAKDICAAFPGMTRHQIGAKATHLNLSRGRVRLVKTGIPLIDAVRDRAHDLNMSMVDVDDLAETGKYFQKAGWNNARLDGPNVEHDKIARAIKALAGTLTITWEPVE